jgi:hypothetical protein
LVQQSIDHGAAGESLLQVRKRFRAQPLQVVLVLIDYTAFAFNPILKLIIDPRGQQSAALGQLLVGAGGHFSKDALIGFEHHQVTTGGHVDLCGKAIAFDTPRGIDLKQFGMDRSSIQAKRQFRNLRTRSQQAHGSHSSGDSRATTTLRFVVPRRSAAWGQRLRATERLNISFLADPRDQLTGREKKTAIVSHFL